MSTNNSTHLSKTPSMATAESAKTYSTQLQSPLYRLPRELRDEIYKHYADGRRSYEYNKDTQKLRYRDAAARAENLGLIVTCKIAAEEMKQVAFQKAEFSTRCSAYDIPEFVGLHSKIARLHYLTTHVQTQRQRMLVCVAELVQASDFVEIEARYPDMGLYFGELLQYAVISHSDVYATQMPAMRNDDVAYQACIDALLFLLNRVNTRNPEIFAQLTSGVFGQRVSPVGFRTGDNNLFKEESLSELLSWKPESWWIPGDEDLSRIELLLCDQRDQGPPYYIGELHHRSLSNTRCYFSAAAVAVDFLHSLPPKRWLNLRKIVLNEDRVSKLRPACHARGLINFCKSNSALRIEHRIGLLNNVLPRLSLWGGVNTGNIQGYACVQSLVPWIKNTLSLTAHGMPADAYHLIIDGSTQEAVRAFEILKHAAAMQEAMLTQSQRTGVQPTSWAIELQKYSTFYLPWHLPTGFPDTIREIMAGTSNIRFTGPVGDLWDPDLMCSEGKDWTVEDWREQWEDRIEFDEIETTFFADSQMWYEQE